MQEDYQTRQQVYSTYCAKTIEYLVATTLSCGSCKACKAAPPCALSQAAVTKSNSVGNSYRHLSGEYQAVRSTVLPMTSPRCCVASVTLMYAKSVGLSQVQRRAPPCPDCLPF
mmetsp:Transcript_23425/g.52233  ORF Transcript_23425/g.52233 Transcript_23425/m.52233 type:complete len:113 (+) Transcript_23425:1076-1414(+)